MEAFNPKILNFKNRNINFLHLSTYVVAIYSYFVPNCKEKEQTWLFSKTHMPFSTPCFLVLTYELISTGVFHSLDLVDNKEAMKIQVRATTEWRERRKPVYYVTWLIYEYGNMSSQLLSRQNWINVTEEFLE